MMARPLFQTTAWVCLAAVVVFSLGAPSLRPMTVLTHSLEHAAIFLLAGLAFGLGYPGRGARVIAALVLFAGAIEIAQLYAPGRHARLGDFIIDACAACAGATVALVITRFQTARTTVPR